MTGTELSGPSLDTALSLNDKDPGFSDRVSNMLCPDSGIEHVARLKDGAALFAGIPISHLDAAIEDGKDLFPVIDVPLVWPICPMQARGDAAHIGNVGGAPGAIRLEGATAKYFHAVSRA